MISLVSPLDLCCRCSLLSLVLMGYRCHHQPRAGLKGGFMGKTGERMIWDREVVSRLVRVSRCDREIPEG